MWEEGRRLELVVHADATEMINVFELDDIRGAARKNIAAVLADGLFTEIDVEIFALGRPVFRKRPFEAGARRPALAAAAFTENSAAIKNDLVIGLGGRATGGGIKKNIVEGVADAQARRGQPVEIGIELRDTGDAGINIF